MADVKKWQAEIMYDDVALDFRITGLRKNPTSTLAGGTDITATFASAHELARDKSAREIVNRVLCILANEYSANGV